MCSGIRDAANLARKLGRVVREESPFELLDSYEAERAPHVAAYTTISAQMANAIETMRASDGEVRVVKAEPLRPQIGPGIWDGSSALRHRAQLLLHMAEWTVPKPLRPIVFAKYRSVLVGPADDVLLPNTSAMVDLEVELVVVIGRGLRVGNVGLAAAAIGGFTVVNDVSARYYQVHESQ
ncbi:hypothetical protein SANTM175S_01691 [Streptomyces antimycoticus]